MKIIAFNGSPRGRRSATQAIVKEFLDGAAEAGAEVETVLLADRKIGHCRGCFTCWTKTPGVCVIKDDMAELLPKLKEPDIVVFATPLYVDNVSGLMKNFLDRTVPQVDPFFEKDPQGEWRHVKGEGRDPKIVVISNCGFPEQTHFQTLKLFFRRLARNMHSEVVGEIYRGEGPLLGASSVMLKFLLRGYKKAVRRAGREIVESGRISEETAAELEKPLVPFDKYIEKANEHWASALKKRKGAG